MAESTEKTDLLATLDKHRGFLRYTVRNLTEEQARERTTKSALSLGALVKHVTAVEKKWISFVVEGPRAMAMPTTEAEWAAWQDDWTMAEGETLRDILDRYDEVAKRTTEIVETLPSLDVAHPLPEAPWFEAGAHWSARRVLLHVLAETSQHAGHADIIRESLDGQKTMG